MTPSPSTSNSDGNVFIKLGNRLCQSLNVTKNGNVGLQHLNCFFGIFGCPLLLNNGIMTHYDKYMPYASKHWASNKLSGDYAKVADGLGAYTETVHTPDELPVAIQRAIAANKEGQPAVLQAMTKGEETVSRY